VNLAPLWKLRTGRHVSPDGRDPRTRRVPGALRRLRILKKPASLDDEEFAVVKRHPELGITRLRELDGAGPAVQDLVHSHHERLDGKGYPRGVWERDLSLDTRILTVCDVYDALVSPRVYRADWSHDARSISSRPRPAPHFDHRCVAALEAVLLREQPRLAITPLRTAAASA
jgi:HD-GYP domain-containing protein (c-di-GMP phosphodiesterase class II)